MTGIVIICFAVILYFPLLCRIWRRGRRERQDFYDLTMYMEQMICSYRRLGNVSLSLEDCVTLFPEDGGMGRLLRRTLHVLKTGDGVEGSDILQSALEGIRERYSSRRLHMLHDFLCHAECMGFDSSETLDILLNDLQMWKRRTLLYQKKKFFVWTETVVAAGLAIGLCWISRFLMPSALSVREQGMYYQWTWMAFLFLLFVLEVVAARRLTDPWLDVYPGKTAGRKQYPGRRAKEEVECEFPYWLLSVSLYLQQDGVYQAVNRSLAQVRGIFAGEVRKFLEGMYEHPSSLEPFTDFFDRYKLPEIQTGMKILYSVNTNDIQDVRKQVHFLVEQSNVIMDKCESRSFDNQIIYMGFLKQIPMVLACGKIVLDMVKCLGDILGEVM